MHEALGTAMRWLHISSVVTLIGGMIYGRLVAIPVCPEGLIEQMALRYRRLVYAAIPCLVISGIYNLLANPGHTFRFFVLLSVKLLLVLHVFAVALLVVQARVPRRSRMMAGVIVSGLIIIAISAYLRRIF